MIKTTNSLPTHCEFCGSELVWDSVNLICNNPLCPHNGYEQVRAWCLNIASVENLGWKTIEKKLNEYFPDFNWTIESLYKLDTSVICGGNYEGSEDTLFRKMFRKLELGTTTVSQFLLALRIPGIGKIGAKAVEKASNVKEIMNSLAQNKTVAWIYDDLSRLLQDKNAAYDLVNNENIFTLMKYVNFDYNTYEMTKGNKGTVVITGTLSIKRADFINLLEQNGWKVADKVTDKVDVLITNDPDSNTTKNKDAKRLGVGIMTEEEFKTVMYI